MILGRSERSEQRGRTLSRLAGLIERGVPLPEALLAAAEGLGPADRRRVEAAASRAREGRGLVEVLLGSGLVASAERPLLEALTGAVPAATVRALGEELLGRAALQREVEVALEAPLRRWVALLALVSLLAVVSLSSTAVVAGTALAPQRSGAGPSPLLLLLIPALLFGVGLGALSLLLRSRLADDLARVLPAADRLLGLHRASTFLRRLGLCLAAGRPLPAALEAAGASFGRRFVAEEARALARRAREGESLAACLARASFLDPSAELLAKETASRADPPRELLALARRYGEEVALEGRALGPVLAGIGEMAALLPIAGVLVGLAASLQALI